MRLTPKMVGEGAVLLPSDMCPEIEISSVLGAQRSNDLVVLPALICRSGETRGRQEKSRNNEDCREGGRGETIKGRREDAHR